MRTIVLVAALAATVPTGVLAQTPQAGAAERRSVAGPVIGGILGGGVGFVAGALVAGAIANEECDVEDLGCLIWSLFVGAEIGEAALLPVGVHIGGGRRGDFVLELVTAAGIGALGLGMTAAVNDPAPLVVVPVLQVLVATVIETRR